MASKTVGTWPAIAFAAMVVLFVPIILFLLNGIDSSLRTLFAFFDPIRWIFAGPGTDLQISGSQRIFVTVSLLVFYAVFTSIAMILYQYGTTGKLKKTVAWTLGSVMCAPIMFASYLAIRSSEALIGAGIAAIAIIPIAIAYMWSRTESGSTKDKIGLIFLIIATASSYFLQYFMMAILMYGFKM